MAQKTVSQLQRQSMKLFREIIAIYLDIKMTPVHTLCGQNAGNVYNNHGALKC